MVVREGQASKLAPIQTNTVQDRAGEGFGARVPKLHTIFGVNFFAWETWVYKHRLFFD